MKLIFASPWCFLLIKDVGIVSYLILATMQMMWLSEVLTIRYEHINMTTQIPYKVGEAIIVHPVKAALHTKACKKFSGSYLKPAYAEDNAKGKIVT